jgi:hypothetical protein
MINHKPTDVTPKFWVEVVVFLTAYYPLFLILLIRDIGVKTTGLAFWSAESGYHLNSWALGFFTLSSVATLFTAYLMRNNLTYQEGGVAINVEGCKQLRGDMLNYTLPFLIGLFAFDYGSWQSIAALLIFLIFMFAFVSKDRVILLNPMFLLMGIRLYEMNYTAVGNTVKKTKTVLCLGELNVSKIVIYTKESGGIEFVYPVKS